MKVTDFIVEAVPRKVIAGFVEKHHYLHSVNGVQHIQCFGLFKEGVGGLITLVFTLSEAFHFLAGSIDPKLLGFNFEP